MWFIASSLISISQNTICYQLSSFSVIDSKTGSRLLVRNTLLGIYKGGLYISLTDQTLLDVKPGSEILVSQTAFVCSAKFRATTDCKFQIPGAQQ